MKACGRRNKTTMQKCGTLFEGTGAYCRDCRNDYQREYYARRKAPLYKPATEKTGASCQACSSALRSNTLKIVDTAGLEASVVLCETCYAAVTYLSETVDEAAHEFIVDLSMELAALRANAADVNPSKKATFVGTPQSWSPPLGSMSSEPSFYQPRVLQPGNVEECGACEAPARPGKTFCEAHQDYEEDYNESNAAKMARGEL